MSVASAGADASGRNSGVIQCHSREQRRIVDHQSSVEEKWKSCARSHDLAILIDREGRLRGVFIGGGPSIADSMKQNLDKTMAE